MPIAVLRNETITFSHSLAARRIGARSFFGLCINNLFFADTVGFGIFTFPFLSDSLSVDRMCRLVLGDEHESCKIPGSPSQRAETRRAIALVAR